MQPEYPEDVQGLKIAYRVQKLEERLDDLKEKVSLCVPIAIIDLRIQALMDAIARLEENLQELRESHNTLATRLTLQQEKAAKTQIKILAATVSTIITIISSIFVAYITHFIH